MAYGLQVLSATGKTLLDTTSRLPKFYAQYSGSFNFNQTDQESPHIHNITINGIGASDLICILDSDHNSSSGTGRLTGEKIGQNTFRLYVNNGNLFTSISPTFKWYLSVFKM